MGLSRLDLRLRTVKQCHARVGVRRNNEMATAFLFLVSSTLLQFFFEREPPMTS